MDENLKIMIESQIKQMKWLRESDAALTYGINVEAHQLFINDEGYKLWLEVLGAEDRGLSAVMDFKVVRLQEFPFRGPISYFGTSRELMTRFQPYLGRMN